MTKETGLPERCLKELADVQKRNAKHAPPGWEPVGITSDCLLHCFVFRDFYIEGQKPDEKAFALWGLSMYAEGTQLSELDLKKALEQQHADGNDFIGAVYFKASDFMTLDEFQVPADKAFQIKHDPFPWTDESEVDHAQHPNHIEVICKKSTTRLKKMRQLCEWSYHPKDGDLRPSLPEFAQFMQKPEVSRTVLNADLKLIWLKFYASS